MSGLRIIHLIHSLKRAGAETNLATLVQTPHHGIESQSIITFRGGGGIADDLAGSDIDLILFNENNNLLLIKKIFKAIANIKPHVVHAHMDDAVIVAAALKKRFGIPFVGTYHNGTSLLPLMPPLRHWLRERQLKWAAPKAAWSTGVTDQVRKTICAGLPVADKRVTKIDNAVPMPDTAIIEKALAARRGEPIHIVAVGRYIELKAFDRLIAAAHLLHNDGRNVRVSIYGSGPLEQSLNDDVSARGLTEIVNIAGQSDMISEILRSATIYVSTSEYEGASIALLEAMSWALPVVVSEVPGNRELVTHGENGLAFPQTQPEALAAAIADLIDDPAKRERLGRAAQTYVEGRFSAEQVLQKYFELYRSASTPLNWATSSK